MSLSQTQRRAAYRIAHEIPDIDQTFPEWARRTNPIVRRQLGEYWRQFPPQLEPIIKWSLVQIVFLLLSIPYTFLFIAVLAALVAAGTLLPYAFYLYVRALGQIIGDASGAMVREYENDTLTLLRVTPFSAREIVLSKIAASVWRRSEDLETVISMALALSLPVIAVLYVPRWSPDEYPGIAQSLTIASFITALLRLPLEMFMVAAIGALMGAATRVRSSAFIGTAVVVFFYFLLINLPRLLSLGVLWQVIINVVLPLVLPLIIIIASIQFTTLLMTRD